MEQWGHVQSSVWESSLLPQPIVIKESTDAGIGFRLWPAAPFLCRHLEKRQGNSAHEFFGSGKRILELGAGCGLVGIFCAHLGAHATLTDTATVLAITRHNVDANPLPVGVGGSLRTCELQWGTDISKSFPRGSFDLIVGSDLTFFQHLHLPLLTALLQLCDTDTQVYLAHVTRREEFDSWMTLFEPHFHVTLESTSGAGVGGFTCSKTVLGNPAAEALRLVQSSQTSQSSEAEPVIVFRLQLRTLPATRDLKRMLRTLEDESREALLARLAMLESDLATIEAESP